MRRPLTLRQIDVFRAVIEAGTVSRAAGILNISQPAASKLLSNLEMDSNLILFERVKGRLIPTQTALQLYEEVEKVFLGLSQIELAVDTLHRRMQERLSIGVIPTLSQFMAQAVLRFTRRHPDVMISIEERNSQYVSEWIMNRRVDIGMLSDKIDAPHLRSQTLIRREVLCAMPKGHRLAERSEITAEDLRGEPIVGYTSPIQTWQALLRLLEKGGVEPNIAIYAETAPLVCQLVAGGRGVAAIHPLGVGGMRDQLILRPLRPAASVGYQLCWHENNRNMRLIEAFSEDIVALARDF